MDLFILTLFAAGYKLRISTLYQLLTGRRTSSVLLHGFFYDNLNYSGTFPKLSQATFDQAIEQLEKNDWITVSEGHGQVTAAGETILAQMDRKPLATLASLRYGRMRMACWQLLAFTIQVVSQLSHGEKDYLPLENRPFYLAQVKHYLAQAPSELLERFPAELAASLASLPPESADFLANQWTGFDHDGQAAFQLLPKAWQEKPWDQLYIASQIDGLLAALRQQPTIYPLLVRFDQKNYNQSMLKTRQLFLAGDSREAIMEKRHLKTGTVNDHLLEWALLDPTFPFDRFSLTTEVQVPEVRDLAYQEVTADYLVFRLSQIYYLKEHKHGIGKNLTS